MVCLPPILLTIRGFREEILGVGGLGSSQGETTGPEIQIELTGGRDRVVPRGVG